MERSVKTIEESVVFEKSNPELQRSLVQQQVP